MSLLNFVRKHLLKLLDKNSTKAAKNAVPIYS